MINVQSCWNNVTTTYVTLIVVYFLLLYMTKTNRRGRRGTQTTKSNEKQLWTQTCKGLYMNDVITLGGRGTVKD